LENLILIPVAGVAAGRALLMTLDRLATSGAIELRAGAVVERYADGRWHLPEETEKVSYGGTLTGGAIGALVGLIGGPAGVLLGGTAGLLVGSSVEVADAEDVETIIHALPRFVPPGGTAVIADIYETDRSAVDAMLDTLGLSVSRMPRAEAERQVKDLVRRFEDGESGPGRPL